MSILGSKGTRQHQLQHLPQPGRLVQLAKTAVQYAKHFFTSATVSSPGVFVVVFIFDVGGNRIPFVPKKEKDVLDRCIARPEGHRRTMVLFAIFDMQHKDLGVVFLYVRRWIVSARVEVPDVQVDVELR